MCGISTAQPGRSGHHGTPGALFPERRGQREIRSDHGSSPEYRSDPLPWTSPKSYSLLVLFAPRTVRFSSLHRPHVADPRSAAASPLARPSAVPHWAPQDPTACLPRRAGPSGSLPRPLPSHQVRPHLPPRFSSLPPLSSVNAWKKATPLPVHPFKTKGVSHEANGFVEICDELRGLEVTNFVYLSQVKKKMSF